MNYENGTKIMDELSLKSFESLFLTFSEKLTNKKLTRYAYEGMSTAYARYVYEN